MKVAIVGATGYTGLELIRILSGHPEVKITAVTSERYAGQPYGAVYPAMHQAVPMILEPLNAETIAEKADIIFTALPHKEAMAVVPYFYRQGKKVIDLSADFRLSDPKVYEKWYQEHTAPELLPNAVYGLPETNRTRIKKAHIVANPGCYPTSILLPLMPLLKEDLITPASIIADSKSGVSGAGRALKTGSLYCEVSDGFKAYGALQHRHQPEIDEQLSCIASKNISISFVPHLVPMNRGMLSSIYVTLKKSIDTPMLNKLFTKYYKKEPFVRLLPDDTLPQTSWVRGTNYCDINFVKKGKRIVLFSAIDNLTKGASGQAVQNMNLMMGLDEQTSLSCLPVLP